MKSILSIFVAISLCSVSMATQPTSPAPDLVQQFLDQPRFYVIISVNEISAANNADLPYALVDAKKVKSAFEAAGFHPLSGSPPLVGKDATDSKVETLLRDIRGLPDKSTVLVYYSGHSWTDRSTKEVWFQLYDNTILGDQGLPFSRLLDLARGRGWKGDLAVIVDSCYSGKVAFGSELMGETAALASSDQMEPSRPIKLRDGEMSAFTHAILLAAGPDFQAANTRGDGILTFGELTDFATSELLTWNDQHLIDGPMHPRLFANTTLIIFKYDQTKAPSPNSPVRNEIVHKVLDENLSPPDAALNAGLIPRASVFPQAQALIKKMLPYLSEGPEKRAFTQLAEGNISEGFSGLKEIRDSRRKSSTNIDFDLMLGRLYTAAGLDTDASEVYMNLLRQSSNPPNEWKLMAASSLTRAHQFAQAQALLLEIVQSGDKNQPSATRAIATNTLGVLYATMGQYKKAERAYKEALKDVPPGDSSSLWVATVNSNLADAYRLNRQVPDAERQYANTINLQEESGSDVSQRISDLEKYSTVLSTAKQQQLASDVQQKAEALKAEKLAQQLKPHM